MPEIQTSFLCPFAYATLRRRGAILGVKFCCIWGPVSRQTPPANPFSEALNVLVDFSIFFIFSFRGGERGESEAPGGGGGSVFSLKIPGGRGGGEGPGGCLGGNGGMFNSFKSGCP